MTTPTPLPRPEDGYDPWAMKMLSRMTFMPGTFVDVTGDGDLRIVMEFAWGDVRYSQMAPGTPPGPTRLATSNTIPNDILVNCDEEAFFAFVRDAVRLMMIHEADEWMTVDGDARWNPHRADYRPPFRAGMLRR